MVKQSFNIFLTILIFCAACILSTCSNDFEGLVASNDLDYRLESKNHFPFLDDPVRNWRNTAFNGNEYKFLIVTDTHIEDGDDFEFRKIEEIIKNDSDIKFAVNLGDITQHGTERDIKLFIDIADSTEIPFYPVIGNHDIYFNNWSVWKEYIGSTNYKIEFRNTVGIGDPHTTLLVLDTANAFFGKDQLDWLEDEINKAKSKNIFVFTHAPLFTTGIKMQQVTDTRERARVMSILRNKAKFMFSGHSHQRAINEAGNVTYVTFEDFRSTNIYIIVHVKPSGTTYEFKKL